MIIPAFRNLSIRAKLVSLTLFLVLVPLLCVSYLSLNRFGKALKSAAEDDLEHLVRNIYSMCMVQQEIIQGKVLSDLNVAREILYSHGREIRIVEDEKVHFDAVNQITNQVTPVDVPLWEVDGIRLTLDNRIVDEVQKIVQTVGTKA